MLPNQNIELIAYYDDIQTTCIAGLSTDKTLPAVQFSDVYTTIGTVKQYILENVNIFVPPQLEPLHTTNHQCVFNIFDHPNTICLIRITLLLLIVGLVINFYKLRSIGQSKQRRKQSVDLEKQDFNMIKINRDPNKESSTVAAAQS